MCLPGRRGGGGGGMKEEGGGKGVVVPALQGSRGNPGKGTERGRVSSFFKIIFPIFHFRVNA